MSSPYWFDEVAATNAVNFFPKYLRFTKGEWTGRPFVLAPWQEHKIIRPLFGWKRADGTRRYRRCWVWVPRKNGKTELAAGVSLLTLIGDGEPAGQVFSIATSKEQASIVFEMASNMVAQSEALEEHLVVLATSIFCPELGAAIRPLAGIPRGKHGLNMSGLIGDEVHEWKNDRLFQFVHQSSASRRQPLEFLISSAGEQTGYGWEAFRTCQAIAAGEIDEPETLVVIFGADPERDRVDPDYWKSIEARKLANPNFGVSVKPDYLAAESRAAQQLPRKEADYKRYHLNLWTEQNTRWLPMDGWNDCGQPPELRPELRAAAAQDRPVNDVTAAAIIPPDRNERWRELRERMKGRRAFGGVDLSSTTDLTALVWSFPPDEEGGLWTIIPRFYCPAVGVKRRSHVDKVPYEHWVATGALTTTPGNAVDYAWLKRDLFADAEFFKVVSVAVDRWNATQITIEFNDEGIDAKLFGQGYASMSGPSKRLEKLVLARQLDHGGHPVMAFCARNVAVETDAADNIKPSKKNSRERIDGIVGAVMGIGAEMENPKALDLADFLNNPVVSI